MSIDRRALFNTADEVDTCLEVTRRL